MLGKEVETMQKLSGFCDLLHVSGIGFDDIMNIHFTFANGGIGRAMFSAIWCNVQARTSVIWCNR